MFSKSKQTRRFVLSGSVAAALLLACASRGTPRDQAAGATLWKEMAGHQSWSQFADHPGLQPGKGPHGKFVSTYINAVAAASPGDLPAGSILVKENYSSRDPASLESLTVMKKIAGYDPQHGDWFWARYEPDGTATHSGQAGMCYRCHEDADGDDLVFLNDA